MNILIVVSSLNYGGAEKQAVLDANMLSDTHNVFLGCFKKGPLLESLNKNVDLVLIRKDNYLLTSVRLAKIIKRNKIEVIHASLFASMVTSVLASLFISKIIIVWHFHSHEYDLPALNGNLYKWMSRFPGIKKILFVNNELRSFLTERFKLPISKTGILYNTTSIKQPLKTKTEGDECIIGYIGRLVELKRVNLLIGCAEYLLQKGFDNFQILIIGDGQERLNLEELTKKNDLNKVVKFKGFQSDTERYYNDMHVFALPSDEECLSMAAIDAGVKGIP